MAELFSYVPTDRILVPIRQYSAESPPWIPNAPMPNIVLPYLVEIAVDLANHATQLASTNPVRAHFYNIITHNYWENYEYVLVFCRVAAEVSMLYLEERGSNMHTNIQLAVSKACSWYSASFMISHDSAVKQLSEQLKTGVYKLINAEAKHNTNINSVASRILTGYYPQVFYVIPFADRDPVENRYLNLKPEGVIVHGLEQPPLSETWDIPGAMDYTTPITSGPAVMEIDLTHPRVRQSTFAKPMTPLASDDLRAYFKKQESNHHATATESDIDDSSSLQHTLTSVVDIKDELMYQQSPYQGQQMTPQLPPGLAPQPQYQGQQPVDWRALPPELQQYALYQIQRPMAPQLPPGLSNQPQYHGQQPVDWRALPLELQQYALYAIEPPPRMPPPRMQYVPNVNQGYLARAVSDSSPSYAINAKRWEDTKQPQPVRTQKMPLANTTEISAQPPTGTGINSELFLFTPDMEPIGGTDMERSHHTLVKLGGAVKVHVVKTLGPYVDTVNEFCREPASSEVNVSGMKALPIDQNVYPKTLLELNVDSGILTNKIKQIEHRQKFGSIKPFRTFIIIVDPILTTVNVNDEFDGLKLAGSFKHLTEFMVRTAKRTNEEIYILANSPEASQEVKKAYLELNLRFTEIVNSFLKNNLRLPIQIEDFIDDVNDLRDYLSTTYNGNYASAFDEFEEVFISSITTHVGESDYDTFKEVLEVPEGISAIMVTIMHSFTHLGVSSDELGLKVGSDLMRVYRPNSPVLYDTLYSLLKHKAERNEYTLVDIVVTLDGVKFKVYMDYVQTDEIYIQRMV